MKIVTQVGIIFSICWISQIIEKLLPFSFPASVIGMILLFILLCVHILKVDHVREKSDFLLENMKAVPDEKRTARFVSAVACVFPDGRELVTRGECSGVILRASRGSGGFGYDPVFYVPEEGMTFAELSAERKNEISHRARALSVFAVRLKDMLG